MECTPLTVTAPKPSFGMPVYGPASDAAPAGLAWADVSFERGSAHVAGIADVRGTGAFRGDDAWSPPPCS